MSIVTDIMDVFSQVTSWLSEALVNVQTLFWTVSDGTVQLTVIGVLTVISLAIGIAMLLFNMVKDFLKFR